MPEMQRDLPQNIKPARELPALLEKVAQGLKKFLVTHLSDQGSERGVRISSVCTQVKKNQNQLR